MSRTTRKFAYRYYYFIKVNTKIDRRRIKEFLKTNADLEAFNYNQKSESYGFEKLRITYEGRSKKEKSKYHFELENILTLEQLLALEDLPNRLKHTLELIHSVDPTLIYFVTYPQDFKDAYFIECISNDLKISLEGIKYNGIQHFTLYLENNQYCSKYWESPIKLDLPKNSKEKAFLITLLLDFKDKQQNYRCTEYGKKEGYIL